MPDHDWVKEFPSAVVVCDREGIILEMNDKAVESFAKRGGAKLIGTNLFDCHPEPARSKLKALMDGRQPNTYTVEKRGLRKLIHQTPWHRDGVYCGFVEVVIEIPGSMLHFNRDAE